MNQEDVRQFLLELGGEATVRQIAELARGKSHSQNDDVYFRERLRLMSKKKKGLVEYDNELWRVTEKGKETEIEYPITELDAFVTEDEISSVYGLQVANIVGSLRLNRELDLRPLSDDLHNTDYHPETYPSMIYRPYENSSLSVLVPSSGRLAIVGATTKEELIRGTQDFLNNLDDMGIEFDKSGTDILVQNIVTTFSIERELELSAVSIELGLENIEYEPEQFPGVIYRGTGNSTILLFGSGKCVITGSKTYLEAVQERNNIIEMLEGIGVELDVTSLPT